MRHRNLISTAGIALIAVLLAFSAGCTVEDLTNVDNATPTPTAGPGGVLRIATTTSLDATGLLAEIEDLGVPRIHFAVNAGHLMEAMAEAGSDAMGVDWRTPLSEARHRLGEGVALQGNLDPTVPLAGPEVLERETRNLLADAPERGHVFNLGHGVLPSTDPGMLTELVGLVHEITEKRN